MRLLFVFAVLFSLAACKEKTGPSKDPENNKFYSDYLKIYRSYNQVPLDSTRIQLETFLKEFPNDAKSWAFYGSVLFRLKQEVEAIAAYRSAVSFDKNYVSAYTGIGSIYNLQNSLDSAALYLQKAIALKDSTPFAFASMALLKAKQGDKEAALALADSAIVRAKKEVTALATTSYVYAQCNRAEQAASAYARAVEAGLKDTATFARVLKGEVKIEDYYRQNDY